MKTGKWRPTFLWTVTLVCPSFPADSIISSTHLLSGRPLLLLPGGPRQVVTSLVHCLLLVLATWSAYFHFNLRQWCKSWLLAFKAICLWLLFSESQVHKFWFFFLNLSVQDYNLKLKIIMSLIDRYLLLLYRK